MSIEAYSLAAEGEKRLTANFKIKEFACADGSNVIFIDDRLPVLLQKIRDHFGRKVTITSGYRTVYYNNTVLPKKGVKTSKNSQHLYGMAADIQVEGVEPATVAAYAETLLPNTGGIGTYPKKTGRAHGWVHIDVRKQKSRWVQ